MKKAVIFSLLIIKLTSVFAQTDTLNHQHLRYITPYESVIYPGMAGKGYTVSTYFKFLPEEDIQIKTVQKNGFVFDLDSVVLNKGKWYILLVKEYFTAKHGSMEPELEILQYGRYPLINVKNPYPSKQSCNKCLLVEFKDIKQNVPNFLSFENLQRYSLHAP
ncbi:MAG: hypothetical protein D6707_04660 [Bacteroidetes bacterium]|nr:MAG: hypothetical protein D6707_04660 [Bacteroidota bacterium]